jgi:hypothetical protein
MKTIILHPSNPNDLSFILTLLERLEIPFEVEGEKENQIGDPIRKLFGSWKSDESGKTIIEEVYSARMDAPREIDL